MSVKFKDSFQFEDGVAEYYEAPRGHTARVFIPKKGTGFSTREVEIRVFDPDGELTGIGYFPTRRRAVQWFARD